MFFPGISKTIPNVPDNLREAVIMAVRIMEGQKGKKVELVGSRPHTSGIDIKYRTKDFTDIKEVEQQTKEIQSWVDNNQDQLYKAFLFLKETLEPMVKLAQKMGMGPMGPKAG